MFRVKVLNRNDLIIYLVKMMVLIIAIVWITRFFSGFKLEDAGSLYYAKRFK